MASEDKQERGIVYTFYSFKGGVGRTMALANVAALLAKWGHSVLIVDWDLEAPGLERFFTGLKSDIRELRATTPGIVDLVQATREGKRLDWHDCLLNITLPDTSTRLSLLSAGRNGQDYTPRLHALDFRELFDKHDLGSYIEELRNEWISEFEFVLIDSRTGVTDIGGICTVHLADVLILLFTTTESSMEGAMQIVERARKEQERLPLDRRRLLAVPVPARDESRTEYEKATEWKNRFAERFGELYRDWLPSGMTAHDALDLLRIPNIPYWSFGEQLPAIEQGTSDPSSIGRSYEILARILATRLDWYAALEGQTLAPPPVARRRELDVQWLTKHRRAAIERLLPTGMNGFMEIYHFLPDSFVSKHQTELLAAAKQAQAHMFGWSIGVVLDNREESRPRPTNDGILAIVSRDHPSAPGHLFAYWAVNKSGDFYTLISLQEDQKDADRLLNTIWFDVRIGRAAEAVVHCANLYKALGVEPNAHVTMSVRYGGLRGRTLTAGDPSLIDFVASRKNLYEGDVGIPEFTFRLGAAETEIVPLTKRLCEPLFVIFDYVSFTDDMYQNLITGFIKRNA